jgi:hypothetical protein
MYDCYYASPLFLQSYFLVTKVRHLVQRTAGGIPFSGFNTVSEIKEMLAAFKLLLLNKTICT